MALNFSCFRHRGVWVLHGFQADQLAVQDGIDHVLDNAERKAIPVPKRIVIRLRPAGWTEYGAKKQVAVWYSRFGVRWCEVNVVTGADQEEIWLRLLTALSAAIVSESGQAMRLKELTL